MKIAMCIILCSMMIFACEDEQLPIENGVDIDESEGAVMDSDEELDDSSEITSSNYESNIPEESGVEISTLDPEIEPSWYDCPYFPAVCIGYCLALGHRGGYCDGKGDKICYCNK